MTALLERQLKTQNIGKRLSLPYMVFQRIFIQCKSATATYFCDAAMMHSVQQDSGQLCPPQTVIDSTCTQYRWWSKNLLESPGSWAAL